MSCSNDNQALQLLVSLRIQGYLHWLCWTLLCITLPSLIHWMDHPICDHAWFFIQGCDLNQGRGETQRGPNNLHFLVAQVGSGPWWLLGWSTGCLHDGARHYSFAKSQESTTINFTMCFLKTIIKQYSSCLRSVTKVPTFQALQLYRHPTSIQTPYQ